MSINKIIKFYTLHHEPCLNTGTMNQQSPSTILHYLFKTAFCEKVFHSFDFDKKTYSFDVKTFNSDMMFATCSVDETIKASSFVQKRNKKTKITKPFTTLENEDQLESYTYFYIDFNHKIMTTISNKKISKINIIISNFISYKTSNLSKVSINPELIDDIYAATKKLNSDSLLHLEFNKPFTLNDIVPLSDVLTNDLSTKSYQIKIKIEETKNRDNFLKGLLKMRENADSYNLTTLNLTGKNEIGLDETINFFEAIYTKTVSLKLTEDTATNLNYIKENLINAINNYLEDFT